MSRRPETSGIDATGVTCPGARSVGKRIRVPKKRLRDLGNGSSLEHISL